VTARPEFIPTGFLAGREHLTGNFAGKFGARDIKSRGRSITLQFLAWTKLSILFCPEQNSLGRYCGVDLTPMRGTLGLSSQGGFDRPFAALPQVQAG
jgi:hypothetical protein